MSPGADFPQAQGADQRRRRQCFRQRRQFRRGGFLIQMHQATGAVERQRPGLGFSAHVCGHCARRVQIAWRHGPNHAEQRIFRYFAGTVNRAVLFHLNRDAHQRFALRTTEGEGEMDGITVKILPIHFNTVFARHQVLIHREGRSAINGLDPAAGGRGRHPQGFATAIMMGQGCARMLPQHQGQDRSIHADFIIEQAGCGLKGFATDTHTGVIDLVTDFEVEAIQQGGRIRDHGVHEQQQGIAAVFIGMGDDKIGQRRYGRIRGAILHMRQGRDPPGCRSVKGDQDGAPAPEPGFGNQSRHDCAHERHGRRRRGLLQQGHGPWLLLADQGQNAGFRRTVAPGLQSGGEALRREGVQIGPLHRLHGVWLLSQGRGKRQAVWFGHGDSFGAPGISSGLSLPPCPPARPQSVQSSPMTGFISRQHALAGKAVNPVAGDDHMIHHPDVNAAQRLHQMAGDLMIMAGRHGRATRMIVRQEDRRRPVTDGGFRDLTRLNQRVLHRAFAHQRRVQHPQLRVETDHIEYFLGAAGHQRNQILRRCFRGVQRRARVSDPVEKIATGYLGNQGEKGGRLRADAFDRGKVGRVRFQHGREAAESPHQPMGDGVGILTRNGLEQQ